MCVCVRACEREKGARARKCVLIVRECVRESEEGGRERQRETDSARAPARDRERERASEKEGEGDLLEAFKTNWGKPARRKNGERAREGERGTR